MCIHSVLQEAAVEYALDHLEERTWAVIALNEADSGRVDYTIRMNFTVLPNTHERVDMIAVGLDYRYIHIYIHTLLGTSWFLCVENIRSKKITSIRSLFCELFVFILWLWI